MWFYHHILEALQVARTKFPIGSDPTLFNMGIRLLPSPDLLAREALVVAISQIGKGESGGNNLGPDVERYVFPAKTPANWCGAFCGYTYEVAAFRLGIPLPFTRSLGAKKLGKNAAAVGRRFTDPTQARPGDLMIFDRGTQGSWQGHVALVEAIEKMADKTCVHTVEGNSGPKVKRMERYVDKDRFAFFASIRKSG